MELEFLVEGYDGMRRSYSSRSDREVLANGMDNYLTFKYLGQKEEWQFYLPDPQHVQLLGGVFKELYSAHISFMERNWGYRTFLFEPITDEQWEDKMIENGYQ